MNEFQIRALFENRFGDTPESFGLSVESTEDRILLTKGSHQMELRIVNNQQAGWYLDGVVHCETPPAESVLKPTDPKRDSNGAALRVALA